MPPLFIPITPPGLMAKIIGQLKDNIAAGRLQKGDKLPGERQMAEMLGLSRATVREALKALEMLGLVRSTHGSGNYLADDVDDVLSVPLSIMFMLEKCSLAQTFELRRGIEFSTAGLAACNASPEAAARMLSLCRQLEESTDENEKLCFDQQLHFEIALASRNSLLLVLLNACEGLIQEHIQDSRARIVRRQKTEAQINAQHRELVDAIVRHDVRRAESAMLRHMQLIADNTLAGE